VGDSIVGANCNIAAGSIFANLRLDEKTIGMKIDGKHVDSGHKKLGGIVGDNVKFGVNVTVMPGKRIWPNMMIPPGITVEEDIEKQPELKKRKR
jgi:bifunctional UDP-N-acetylglucosamine pyrophosphorylase/glucosamine-1-phosphate N-acetyltransferase